MLCQISSIVGFALLFATLSTSAKKQIANFKDTLSTSQLSIYSAITKERLHLFFKGLLFGTIFSFIIVKMIQKRISSTTFTTVSMLLSICLIITSIYYLLVSKSDYMLNHLTDESQIKAWLNIYKTMQHKYLVGLIFGMIIALSLWSSFC